MRAPHRAGRWICLVALLFPLVDAAAHPPTDTPPAGPLTPQEELATFRVLKGFKIELVAAEPDVVDPVAIAFDEDGRMYVAEMHGYPNDGVGTGPITSGKIKLLEDTDGDGVYERSSTFAENLRFPTSVMPYRGGLLAAIAPDLVYFEGPDAKGKARGERVLYSGFALENIQQLPSGLQWGLDNWVYAMVGGQGGTVRSVEKPDLPGISLRSRGFRFQPDVAGSLQPISGGGQVGLTADEGQHWFTATNNQHIRQIVLPDHYLRRNPYLAVSAVTVDIAEHGAACAVHRISPFEAWRVERTTRRKAGTTAKHLPQTELVPGGYITSACSPLVYTGGLLPQEFAGNCFVCDPANNLIHRDVLKDGGSVFTAQRGDVDCEFLASTDIWFRPVHLTVGPDGAIYVCDFYREVIETPLSLPDDIKKMLNLDSRERGRIWRITRADGASSPPPRPALSKASTAALVSALAHKNSWWRFTAQRLLIERQDRSAVALLERLFAKHPSGRMHTLWTLEGLQSLNDALIEKALANEAAGVREQALRLAETRLAASTRLRRAVATLADDPSPRVRFQLAFTLGAADADELASAWLTLARRDAGDSWVQTALLTSTGQRAATLLGTLAREPIKDAIPVHAQLLSRLAGVIGAGGQQADLIRAVSLLGDKTIAERLRLAVLEGLGQGLQQSGRSLPKLWEDPALMLLAAKVAPFFERAAVVAVDDKQALSERLAAIRLLAIGPFHFGAGPLAELLTPRHPPEVQAAAVRALSSQNDVRTADLLLSSWRSYSPSMRREVTEALLGRAEHTRRLLDAVENKQVLPGQIDAVRIDQLQKHGDATIRKRAAAVWASRLVNDRQKLIAVYKAVLAKPGKRDRGQAVFQKNCAMCHRLGGEGVEVGADLLAALKTRTPESLLIDILDPSREVDPRYLIYLVTTRSGQALTGMIAVETPSSLTLRRADKVETTILRSDIEEMQVTAKSLMPEDLEKQITPDEMRDLLAFLRHRVERPLP